MSLSIHRAGVHVYSAARQHTSVRASPAVSDFAGLCPMWSKDTIKKLLASEMLVAYHAQLPKNARVSAPPDPLTLAAQSVQLFCFLFSQKPAQLVR